jgi:hypothetical protein
MVVVRVSCSFEWERREEEEDGKRREEERGGERSVCMLADTCSFIHGAYYAGIIESWSKYWVIMMVSPRLS